MQKRWLFTLVFLLCLLPVLAFAELPRPGVYEKNDGNQARLIVLERHGEWTKNWWQEEPVCQLNTSPKAPYIAAEALSKDGLPVVQMATVYTWKTPSAGAGENWLWLAGSELDKAYLGGLPFTPRRYRSDRQLDFSVSESAVQVRGAGMPLDGSYTFVRSDVNDVPLAMLLFAREEAARRHGVNTDSLNYVRQKDKELPDTYAIKSSSDSQVPVQIIASRNLDLVQECPTSNGVSQIRLVHVEKGSWQRLPFSWQLNRAQLTEENAAFDWYARLVHDKSPVLWQGGQQFFIAPAVSNSNDMLLTLWGVIDKQTLLRAKAIVRPNGQISETSYIGQGRVAQDNTPLYASTQTGSTVLSTWKKDYPVYISGYVPNSSWQSYVKNPASGCDWAYVSIAGSTDEGYLPHWLVSGNDQP